MPPNKNMDDFCTMLWSGMFGLNWKLSKEGKKRFFDEFLPLLHDTKHHVLGKDDDNSWYLVYVGTKPASRGKGYAKRLIEYTTKQVNNLKNPLSLPSLANLFPFSFSFSFVNIVHLGLIGVCVACVEIQADVENRICYLECSNILNLKLYGRLGFRMAKKIQLVRGEKPGALDVMIRLPVGQQLVGKTAEFAEREGGK